MTEYRKEIEKVKNPKNISEALYASSPYTLKKAFENDQTVLRLVKAGHKVTPLLVDELEKNGLKLNEITLSCFVYILHKVDPKSVTILKPLFVKAMESPGAFFVYFAAHALRQENNLPTKPLELNYTRAELRETLKKIS